jgi:hypothetical protein
MLNGAVSMVQHACQYWVLHFKSALISLSLLASSSFLKSLVFWARSFLCVSVSLWCATMSEATVSSCGMRVVRSISGAASASCSFASVCALSPYFSMPLWPFGICSPPLLSRGALGQPHFPCPVAPQQSFSPPCPRRPPSLRLYDE